MLIKYAKLDWVDKESKPMVYFVTGPNLFQLETIAKQIKKQWRLNHNDAEIQTLEGQNAADWHKIEQEVNSYELFQQHTLLDVRVDKKNLDSYAKSFLRQYVAHPNNRCLIVISAHGLAAKDYLSMAELQQCHVLQLISPDIATIKQWLISRLQACCLSFNPDIVDLIYQYTQGNLFAAEQVLTKIAIITDGNQHLTTDDVIQQLSYQCDYPLFELADACLAGNVINVLQLLHQAFGNKTDPTFILWLLTQEIRMLMHIQYHIEINPEKKWDTAVANALKIWPKRINLYQSAITRYKQKTLLPRLWKACHQLDLSIKTSQHKQVWQQLEIIAITLCTARQMDDA